MKGVGAKTGLKTAAGFHFRFGDSLRNTPISVSDMALFERLRFLLLLAAVVSCVNCLGDLHSLDFEEATSIISLTHNIPDLVTAYGWDLSQTNEICSSSNKWRGIGCKGGHIESLKITGPEIEGRLTRDILGLKKLKFLDLSSVRLKNQISNEVASFLFSLEQIVPARPFIIGSHGGDLLDTTLPLKREDTSKCTTPWPGPYYICWQNQWTYFNTTVAAGGSIDLSASPVTVAGSIYMDTGSWIITKGIQSYLKVTGCAVVLATANVTLQATDLTKIKDAGPAVTWPLIYSDCQPVSMPISIVSIPYDCHTYNVSSKAIDAGGTWSNNLSFSLNPIHCYYWWITLLSIIGITVVLVLFLFAIRMIFCGRPQKKKPKVVIVDVPEEEYELDDIPEE